jgi:hypothetical protein
MISVIYLLRNDEKWYSNFDTFSSSINKFNSGIEFDLHIILKGFNYDINYNIFFNKLNKINNISIHYIEDVGFDLNAYYKISKIINTKLVFFMNSYSFVRHNNWLLNFYIAHIYNKSSFVGSTASCESLHFKLPYLSIIKINSIFLFIPKLFKRLYFSLFIDNNFPKFPNPHIRTNSFLIDRQFFLDYISLNKLPETKNDCYKVESGVNSLSRYIDNIHGNPGIINCNGTFFPLKNIKHSYLFRGENSDQIIVGDNRTIEYDRASNTNKCSLRYDAWGNL